MRQTRLVDDLRVPPGPGIPHGLTVPSRELVEQFSHASGPGGQGVNTADSRVQLSLDIATTSALTDSQRRRVLAHAGTRANGTTLSISAAEHRSQLRNRAVARDRLAGLLREALAPPPPARRATKPTRGSQTRRLAAKRTRAETKQQRRRPTTD